MKVRIRRITAVMLVLMMLVMCAGCGKDSNNDEMTKNANDSTSTVQNAAENNDSAAVQTEAEEKNDSAVQTETEEKNDSAVQDKTDSNASSQDTGSSGMADMAGMFAGMGQAAVTDETDNPEVSGMPGGAMGEAMGGMDLSALLGGQDQPDLSVLAIPEDSRQFSFDFAKQVLALCGGHNKQGEAQVLYNAGFAVLKQENFDKSDADDSDTCAYSAAQKNVIYKGEERTLIAIVVRGTNAAEWYSNFDCVHSASDDAGFAENFLFAAEVVNLGIRRILLDNPDALVLVCGHSRGAACANLLGVLLNAQRDPSEVFVYTFATPSTVMTDDLGVETSNIFNLINPCDVVTKVPVAQWGFHRAGTDIVLPAADPETVVGLETKVAQLAAAVPRVSLYYTEKHSLNGPGVDENGMTAYEFTRIIAAALSGVSTVDGVKYDAEILSSVSPDSDFAPLVSLFGLSGGENAMMNMLIQHLPNTYQALMNAMQEYMAQIQ